MKIFLSLVLFFGIFFSGCDKNKVIKPSGKVVKVLVVAPFSGKDKRLGDQSMLGLKSAKKMKKYLPNGDEIVFELCDTKSRLSVAKREFSKIVNNENIVAAISFMSSTNMVSMRDEFKKYKIPAIATIATNNDVVKEGGYVSQICMSNHHQSLVAAHYVRDEKLMQYVGIVFESKNRYSVALAKEFRDVFIKIGGKVNFFIDVGDKKGLEKLKNTRLKNTEILFSSLNSTLTAKIFKIMHNKNWDISLLGSDGLLSDALEETPKDITLFDGIYVVDHYAQDLSLNKRRKTFEKYLEKDGYKNSTYALLAYDGYQLLRYALETCPKYDKECINAVFQDSDVIKGIAGNFSMLDAKVKREIYVDKIQNATLHKEVIIY